MQALDPERLEPLIGRERMARFDSVAAATREQFGSRAVISINSTAVGGGVAEMLQTLLAYVRGVGIDARWLVIEGDAAFFDITKRVHNGLYGGPGDGGPLGDAERAHYEAILRENAEEIEALVHPGDVVLLHDPQTAGLADALIHRGARVVWRCHVGRDDTNEWTDRAWGFLRPYLENVPAFVFSRAQFIRDWMPRERCFVIQPSIDPFSIKNATLERENVERILRYVGLIEARGESAAATFLRRDGSPATINRHADVLQTGPPPPGDAPLVVQVSRWDEMKDMAGVMEGFAHHVDVAHGAHLILAGPAVTGVADDPEAPAVLNECMERWYTLPHGERHRVHLACIPTRDRDENAAIVNALQRHAAIVAQKSLAEGFGLTVAEAMWKERPIVASAVGGITDQIENGVHGLLVADPHDLPAFGAAIDRLLADPAEAARLAANARARATSEFLGDRHLEEWAELFRFSV